MGSSPYDSPSRIDFTTSRVEHYVQKGLGENPVSQNDGSVGQETMAVLKRPEIGTEDLDNADDYSDDLSIFQSQCEKSQRPLDFENNCLIWFPPPPEDENDEVESGFFAYDDEDDDIGDSGAVFSSSSSLPSMFPAKEKQNEGNKEPLRAVVHGHFRALVSQLLQGEDIKIGKENGDEDWLDIITTIAWQAANFVKPDTSRGGSMDPSDYVKVKCIASGSPSDRYNILQILEILNFHILDILLVFVYVININVLDFSCVQYTYKGSSLYKKYKAQAHDITIQKS